MNFVELIAKKRDGGALSTQEIQWVVDNTVAGTIPDYQLSAFLMAVFLRGINHEEVAALTQAMVNSGEQIDLSSIQGIKVDKHSTGGVGDKVSLVLAPLVASTGVPVPMMAGRGLGHTGGTLDKLEAIPGFRTDLSEKEFSTQIEKIGCAIMGQTERIVPADRKLYALRDVTATVPSFPLICSSIISKKKAEGTDALVLDVKFGRGAFSKTYQEALELAGELVKLGNDFSIRTVALLTAMEQPLGNTVGNWVETKEAVEVLKGHGPADLMEVVKALGGIMLVLGKKADSIQDGMKVIQESIDSGKGFERFLTMVKMQGGDLSVVENPDTYPVPKYTLSLESSSSGYVASVDALGVGRLAVDLGAGRTKKDQAVDPGAGIILHKKRGDRVEKGELLATIYTNRKEILKESRNRLLDSFAFSENVPPEEKLIETLIDEKKELNFG